VRDGEEDRGDQEEDADQAECWREGVALAEAVGTQGQAGREVTTIIATMIGATSSA